MRGALLVEGGFLLHDGGEREHFVDGEAELGRPAAKFVVEFAFHRTCQGFQNLTGRYPQGEAVGVREEIALGRGGPHLEGGEELRRVRQGEDLAVFGEAGIFNDVRQLAQVVPLRDGNGAFDPSPFDDVSVNLAGGHRGAECVIARVKAFCPAPEANLVDEKGRFFDETFFPKGMRNPL